MKNIRRSLNKDRIGAPTPSNSSIQTSHLPPLAPIVTHAPPVRQAGSPVPPKRVIRAVQAYRARSNQELSFEKGDFFHVVSDQGGEDWFDASNPMTGARGLVPSALFQILGRNERETALGVGTAAPLRVASPPATSPNGGWPGQQQQQFPNMASQPASQSYSSSSSSLPMASRPQQQQQQQSYGSMPPAGPSTFSPPMSPNMNGSTGSSRPASGNSRKSGPGGPGGAKASPLYGVVQYDFVAERPDELDAKRGEPIIIIAQSNHEWFVAKPIGRLGGPGLIPVAFVEIQDMATGKPVDNVDELIKSSVVPKVEEWKKMTADYKSASIPLGRFDFAQQGGGSTSPSASPIAQPPPLPNQPQQGYGSLSPDSSLSPNLRQQQQQQAGGRQVNSDYGADRLAPNYPPTHPSHSSPALAPGSSSPVYGEPPRASSRTPDQGEYSQQGGSGSSNPGRPYSYSRERLQYGLVTAAAVESFHQEEGSFWFHVRAFFSTGASLILYRLYSDFHEFQMAMMEEFPVEAGNAVDISTGQMGIRILPRMPGRTEYDYEDEVVCAQRVKDLTQYLGELVKLPSYLRSCGLMYEFFVPRPGDVEVKPGNVSSAPAPASAARSPDAGSDTVEGQYGEVVEYLNQMDGSGAGAPNGAPPPPRQQQQQQDVSSQMERMNIRGDDGYGSSRGADPRRLSGSSTNQSQQGGYSNSGSDDYYKGSSHPGPAPSISPPAAPLGTANQNVPYVKIKIFHRNTDDLIAIRVPPNVSHAALLDKVRERLGNDVEKLRYREELGSGRMPSTGSSQVIMAGGARLVSLNTDEELDAWVHSGGRLVLYAD